MKKLFKLGVGALLAVGLVALGSSYSRVDALNTPKEKFNPEFYNVEDPSGYYDSLNMNLTEEAFREDLYDIISKDYKPHSYKENNTTIRYTDVDPNNPDNVIGFYSGLSLSGGWNKEHVWAKSHGFPSESTLPYRDAHHLRPTLNHINSTRSNYDFGELPDEVGDQYGNKCDREVFEPRDEVKGDVARIMFYMATRYGKKSGFNLELVTARTTTPKTPKFGGLNTLLKWHYNDPVSKEEVYRNNAIYYLFQNNRNPYIDHPEWVDLAYPSEYANQEVDEAKVLKVIDLINLLPTELIRPDRHQVMSVQDAYFSLNFSERKLVTNYSKLDEAVKAINELDIPLDKPNPDKPNPDLAGSRTIDFSKNEVSNYSYTTSERSLIIDGVSIKASASGKFNHYVRFGSSSIMKLPDKFDGSGRDGFSIELDHRIDNISSFGFTIHDDFGTISSAELYLSTDDGLSYTKLPYELNPKGSTISLTELVSGKLALVFRGSKPRVEIENMTIATKEVVAPKPEPEPKPETGYEAFIDTKASASISFKLDKGISSDYTFRLGGALSMDLYNPNAKYGVIALKDEILLIEPGAYEATSINKLVSEGAHELRPRRYSPTSFDLTLSITDFGYDTYYNAYLYMELDGMVYISQGIKTSFNETKEGYIRENVILPEYIEILKKIQ